jgi:hypothetical protein
MYSLFSLGGEEKMSETQLVIAAAIIVLAEARKQICKQLEITNGCIYPSEMADTLNMDYDLCLEALVKLYRQGKIAIPSEEEEEIYDKKSY